MKKYLYLGMIILFIPFTNVMAKNYTNENGIVMTDEEYNYIGKLYYDGYQNIIDKKELEDLRVNDIIGKEIENYEYSFNNGNYINNSVENSTRYKKIVISKSCSNNCIISLKAKWLKIPKYNSWDVIGFRVENSTILNQYTAKLSSTNYSKMYNVSKSTGNGIGYSVKLNGMNNMVISASVLVTSGGTVYGAYEHAKTNVTEKQSNKYMFSIAGQGNVFMFDSSINNKYDNTKGVYINT